MIVKLLMTKEELLQALSKEYPERYERTVNRAIRVSSSLQEFLDELSDRLSNISVADGRSASGNPYEQIVEDLGVLLCAAERLSGLKVQHPWER